MMSEENHNLPMDGQGMNGVPPLGLQQNQANQQASINNQLPKRRSKSRYLTLVIGGLVLVMGVLVGGYFYLIKPGKIAKIQPPDCGSLMPQDCETVPGCKLERKEVTLSNNKCNNLMPQDCETVPGCKLISKKTTIKKQCTPGNCDHPGCSKDVIEVGGKCLCDPTSEGQGRISKSKQNCEKYDGCYWVPKKSTVCKGTYEIPYTNEYCVSDGSKKYVNEYCVVDKDYKPPKPKNNSSNQNKAKTVTKKGDWYWCNGSSDEACYKKHAGDSCMGGNGTCKVLKEVPGGGDGISSPRNAICTCYSHTCNKGASHGCGAAPNNIPKYNKTAKIGPFPEDGKLVLLFQPLDVDGDGGVKEVIINYEGKDYQIRIGKGRQRIITNIKVKAGTTAMLVRTVEREQHDECAPHDKPHQGIGWIPVNADQTCGSGLPGPPQGGKCTPFAKPSVKSAIEWAKSFGQPILSKECWADWMEWPGDYDFNDYFIMFSYIPEGVSCQSLTKDVVANIVVGDKVGLTCKGINASGEGKLKYEFRYSIDGGDYQSIKAEGNKATLTVEKAGLYQVECRVCLEGTNICSSQWLPASTK